MDEIEDIEMVLEMSRRAIARRSDRVLLAITHVNFYLK